MFTILPTACLKVNQDTYYIPDENGGIYFRNQKHSFRMQGSNVYQWMEKLIPMFDGTHTMQVITDGLPEIYQQRVYEFATILLHKGFIRDISKDQPHTLSEKMIKTYQPQINYLDHQIGSGAARFEKYRQTSLLVIGSGPFLTSLLSSLLESGIQTVFIYLTDKPNTNIKRIQYLETEAQKIDSAVKVQDITPTDKQPWSKIIQPYNSILFVEEEADIEQMIDLATVCEQENKCFLPAVTYQSIGMVGPAIDWESAWWRLEKTTSVVREETNHTALAILANLLSFQWFQLINNITSPEKNVYLLDMQTLEGKWHSFLSHPLIRKSKQIAKPLDSSEWSANPKHQKTDIQSIFSQITSEKAGIFRSLGPVDLLQLPLSQCRVEIADPLEKQNLPPIICSGLTHMEARREAGLRGLETYAARLLEETNILPADGKIGVGQNLTEAIYRGFIKCLETNLNSEPTHAQIVKQADEQNRYLIDCLHTLGVEPSLYLEQHSYGFPIGWVQVKDFWFSSAGLTSSMALQTSLQKALHFHQNQPNSQHYLLHSTGYANSSFCSMKTALETIIQRMKKHSKQIQVCSLKLEDILSQHLSIVGVIIREEKS